MMNAEVARPNSKLRCCESVLLPRFFYSMCCVDLEDLAEEVPLLKLLRARLNGSEVRQLHLGRLDPGEFFSN